MKNKKTLLLIVSILVVVVMSVGILSACNDKGDGKIPDAGLKKGTYRTTTAVMPSNWCELTYADNNDTQILNYLTSSFFEYDFDFDEAKGGKYNKDGTVNVDAVVEGSYTTNYSAATALKDVTADVDKKWGYTADQKAEGGYAWEITLRDDLKWDDGTAISADDFIYSMQEQLNPDFLNMRANTFYETLLMKGAYNYFYSKVDYVYVSPAKKGYKTNAEALAAGETLYLDVYALWGANGYVTIDGKEVPQWVPIDDTTVYAASWTEDGKGDDEFSAKDIWDSYSAILEVGAAYGSACGVKIDNPDKGYAWEKVGFYKTGDLSFVICMDKSFEFLKEDGSLSYLAAYYMQSLPLVKRSLYEQCKIAPATGSTLWTSNYDTSKDTTASWGPYKLAEFQSGKSYKLVRNDNWFGYGIDLYANQYNVTAVECECVPEPNTQWLKFFAGETDDVALDSEHFSDYKDSKYLNYTPGTGTFGMQLFGNLNVLKNSGNNNGILAIDEFRQAISLQLSRSDVVEKIWPGTTIACYGLMNTQYFYDVENGGVYRYTEQAKKGLLRAYGFTEENGKWSDGDMIKNASLDDAYDALTGFNPVKAKELVKRAYEILTADAAKYGYDATKKITLVYGSSLDNAKQRQRAQYLQDEVIDKLCKDTALEGKIEIVFDASAGSKWADAFRSGKTQIGFGYGFSGNPFNPFDIVGSFVDPDNSLNYHTYWDTSKVELTLKMPEGNYDGAGETITMGLDNWYFCLNGLAASKNAEKKYNWDAGKAPASVRLEILAALEEQVIKKAYSIMLIGEVTGGLTSGKFTQFTEEFNNFMSFGGLRYIKVNYTDEEWASYVSANNNNLESEYKKSE